MPCGRRTPLVKGNAVSFPVTMRRSAALARFGSLVNEVLSCSQCPVAATRCHATLPSNSRYAWLKSDNAACFSAGSSFEPLRSTGLLPRGLSQAEAYIAPAVGPHSIRSYTSTARQTRTPASAADLGLYLGAAAVAMVGLSYAMVPLYKMFCAATGYGGAVGGLESVEDKLRRRQQKPDTKVEQAAAEREITVWFNGDVAEDMPWQFKPTQEFVKVRPGQSTLVFFTAKNKSNVPVTGYSVYNVTPDKAATYFNKIQCFCFEMQRLKANEEIDMPVFFYLDPELATDWHCRNVNDITLSYMFHKVDDEDLDEEDLADDAPTVIKLHGPAGSVPLTPGMTISLGTAAA